MATVKIKPTHESQGDYVIIEEKDFDAKAHELYEDKPKRTRTKTTKEK